MLTQTPLAISYPGQNGTCIRVSAYLSPLTTFLCLFGQFPGSRPPDLLLMPGIFFPTVERATLATHQDWEIYVTLTHIDKDNRPTMVDVSNKAATLRTAVAQSVVAFPKSVFEKLQALGMNGKKGPVIDTAIIAGVMAAKRTHDLIPFCHPLPIDSCKIVISEHDDLAQLHVVATVKVTHKTGVEMEALTAASIAALTIYDMCKALSHDIVIMETKLIEKTGGKSDVRRTT